MLDGMKRKVIFEKDSNDDENYNLYTAIALDTDDNEFKIITGKYTDKKAAYHKLADRGYVVRKVLEKKVFDWIEKNAKTNLDAYAMFSTAISKWRNNNLLSEYYVKLLNDIPELNRERLKGNPNTKGAAKKGWDESVELEEDLTDLHPYFLGNGDYAPSVEKLILRPVKRYERKNGILEPVEYGEPIILKDDIVNHKPLRFDTDDGNKYYNPLFWDTIYTLMTVGDEYRNIYPLADKGYVGLEIEKEGKPETKRFFTNGEIKNGFMQKGSDNGYVREKSADSKIAAFYQNTAKDLQNKIKKLAREYYNTTDEKRKIEIRNEVKQDKNAIEKLAINYNLNNWNNFATYHEKEDIKDLEKQVKALDNTNPEEADKLIQEIKRRKEAIVNDAINRLKSKDKSVTPTELMDILLSDNDSAKKQKALKDINKNREQAAIQNKLLQSYIDDQNTYTLEREPKYSNPKDTGNMNVERVLSQIQKRMNLEDKLIKLQQAQATDKPVKRIIDTNPQIVQNQEKHLYAHNREIGNDNSSEIAQINSTIGGNILTKDIIDKEELALVKQKANTENKSTVDIFDYYRKNPEKYKEDLINFVDDKRNKEYTKVKHLQQEMMGNKFNQEDFDNRYKQRYLNPENFKPVEETDESTLDEVAVNYGVDAAKVASLPKQNTSCLGGTISEEIAKDTLNPELFENDKLKSNIKDALIKVANLYKEDLKLPFEPIDIYLTGSCANYNYNDNSDIDVHLVYDYEQAGVNAEILDQYLKTAKKVFNDKYSIVVKGFPVEVGSENIATPLIATGVYSLMNDNWIREPEKINEIADPDEPVYNEIVLEIEDAIQSHDSEIIGALWKKLGAFRKESLATEGEFGPGNAIFKKLRNNEYLNRLKDTYYDTISSELSLESLEEID